MKLYEAIQHLPKFDMLELAQIGSAYTCESVTPTDFDLMLWVNDVEPLWGVLVDAGFSFGGSNQPGGEDDCWQSWTKLVNGEKLNLVIVDDRDYFLKWKAAAEVCKYLQLAKKEDRINVHCIIMDGYTAQQCRKG